MQSYTVVLALVLVAAVQGFAPASQGRAGSQLDASLFDRISNMDLFAPKKDQNTYGARNKKDLRIGKIEQGKSYIPSGLTAKQYEDIRKTQQKKKADNYQRNVAKAGIFEDYTEFYTKRGTDLSQDWAKNKNTLGHRFAKTKYDWSGTPGKNFGTTTAAVKKDDGKKKKKFSFGKK
mmetsp:Transcript_10519/g.22283  ORF Transcript_10519/g.22283 Transcript_10519/m.22283 type:complete len:176 (-) Transcript_10519:76-603(-)